MSSMYKGLAVPDYTDSADAPLAFQQLIDSGPVARFANATARNAAIPAPVKGTVIYRLDTSVIEIYDGTAWKSVNPLIPPAHTHPGSQITNLSITGGKIANDTIPVAGANKKITGVIENANLPNASLTAQGIVQLVTVLTDASEVKALTAKAAQSLVAKAGGVMTGSLQVPGGTSASPGLKIGGGGEGIYSDTSNALEFKAGAQTFRFSGNGLAFLPGGDNDLALGGSSYRWTSVWAVDGGINTSDPSKKVIEGRLGGGVLKMVQDVMPIRFRWIEGDDGIHYGFDASEVEVVIPTVVKGEPGNRGIRERDLLAILWAAVRELDRRTANGV
jgi:hypothetical protein